MRRRCNFCIPLGLIMLSFAACSTGGETDSEGKPTNATRSATCLQWQEVSCDYVTEKCAMMDHETCEQEFQALYCQADETARACINALGTATCPAWPSACEEVTDPEPARWYCEQFIDALCSRVEACDMQTRADCMRDATPALPCDDAEGARPSIGTCLQAMKAVGCSQLSAGLPQQCVDVIVFNAKFATLTSAELPAPWAQELTTTPGAESAP